MATPSARALKAGLTGFAKLPRLVCRKNHRAPRVKHALPIEFPDCKV
jgi:hypothetical protein